MVFSAIAIGGSSLFLFAIFLCFGAPFSYQFNLGAASSALINISLSMLFFLQHSGMVRVSFSKWLAKHIPEHFYSAVYAIFSGLALLLVVIFWQKIGEPFIRLEGVYLICIWLTYLTIGVWVIWAIRSLSPFDAFGVQPVLNKLHNNKPDESVFRVCGPYRWVRHPLYTAVLIMIWIYSTPTADRLLFNLLWTVWIIFGTIWEERDLLKEFGEPYKRYQKNVPMLIPSIKLSRM